MSLRYENFVPSGDALFCLTQMVNSEGRFALLTVKQGFADETLLAVMFTVLN